MGNTLNVDLTDQVVIFRQSRLTVPASKHPFRVKGGFGASPNTMGRALFGEFLSDGEECRMEGYDVERLATEDEIADALRRQRGLE